MGPIIRTLTRNRVRTGLLVVEIAVTLAVALNCLGLLLDQRRELTRDTGLDEAHLIAVELQPWSTDYRDREFRNQLVTRDLAALRGLSGVADASAIRPFPLQGGGSSMLLRRMGAPDSELLRAPRYTADDHVISTLGLELAAGRGFTPDDLRLDPGPQILNTLVTQDLADALFPDGDALGQTIDTGSAEWPDVIVGIVKTMHTPYGGGPMEDRILIYPGLPSDDSFMSYLLRAQPGQRDRLIPELGDVLRANDERRVVEVKPFLEVKALGYALNRFLAGLLATIIALLLVVTALGIFGMTSFSVTRRTREVGTRRALGASRGAVARQFLLETALVGVLGSAIGLAGAVALNVLLVAQMDATPLSPMLAVGGLAVLWALGFAATVMPALRAARIAPAVATRTV